MRTYLIIFGILLTCFTYGQDTLTVDRLDYRFVSYEDGLMEPIISLEDADVAGVLVPCELGVQVEFCGINPFDVWVDGRLVLQKTKGEKCEYLSLEKLCQIAQRDTVFISVVSQNRLKGISARTFIIRQSKQDTFEILRRKNISEFIYFGFVGCFLAMAILKTNFIRGKISLRKPNLQSFTGRFLSVDSLVMQLVALFVTAFSFAIFRDDSTAYDWVSSFIFLLVFWGMLLVITWVSATVFNFKKLMNWQLTFTIKYWFALAVAVFLIQFIDQLFYGGYLVSNPLLIYVVVCSLVGFVGMVIYVSMSQRGMKSLHIFIYLCSTEILPISLVIYRFLE